MLAKIFKSCILLTISSFLLSACDYKNNNNENLKTALSKNVRWQDQEGLISFEVQGGRGLGLGYLRYAGTNLEGKFEFYIGQYWWVDAKLYFYSDNRLVPNGCISFSVKYVSSDVISLTIKNKKEYAFDWTESSKTYHIEKTKLKEDEIDARYFLGYKWADKKRALLIYNNFLDNVGAYYGTFYKSEINFDFMEDKKFYLSTLDGSYSSGTYSTNLDDTVLLIVKEGNALSLLGTSILLESFT